MALGGMMTACVLALTALVAAGGLRVETGTPAALCPDIGEVRRAVRERLNVEGGGEWLASYDLVHRPDAEAGDVVRVELRDPAGRLRLRRDLPRSGESCVALAQAVALVLESFFRRPTEPPDERRHRGSTRRRVSGGAGAPGGAGMGARAGSPRRVGRRTVRAGARRQCLVRAGVGIALGLRCGGRLDGHRAAADHRSGASGQAAAIARSTLFRGWVARRLRVAAPVELLVGPEVVVGIDRMDPTGVPNGMSNVRAAPGAGGRAQLRLQLAPRVALSLVAALDVTPPALAGRFEIDGLAGELFPVPTVRLFVGAGLCLTLFP